MKKKPNVGKLLSATLVWHWQREAVGQQPGMSLLAVLPGIQ